MTPTVRTKWIDIARGIGIILVVYAHAARGLVLAGTLPPSGWAIYVDSVVYAFHMPLFFILAGLNIERSVARGRRGFITNKLLTVVWPYFLWSFLHGGLKLVGSSYTNSPISLADLLAIPFVPIEQFWFLYVLFLCQLAIALVLPRRWLLVMLTAFGVAAWCTIADQSIFFRALHYLPYVVAGIFARPSLAWVAARPGAQWIVMTCAWLAFAALIHLVAFPVGQPGMIYGLALLGSLGTAMAAMKLEGIRLATGWLETLGRLSMPIFLMHTIFSAAMRAGLKLMGVHDSGLALVLVTAAGLIFSLVAYRIAVVLNMTRLLGFGAPIAR